MYIGKGIMHGNSMKISRRQLRQLINEAVLSEAEKIANQFVEARHNESYIRHAFRTAVTLGHAQEGTLQRLTRGTTSGTIIQFVASPELANALRQSFGQLKSMAKFKSGLDIKHPGMYRIVYAIY